MLKTAVKILISVLLIALVLWRVDERHLIQAFRQVSWFFYTQAVLFQFLLLFLPALAQILLFRALGFDISLLKIYDINLKSMFYSLIVPGDVAGGLARFLKFSKAHRGKMLSTAEIRSTILTVMGTDRLLNMGALIVPLAPLLFISPLPDRTVWFQKAGLLASLIFLVLIVSAYTVPWSRFFFFLPKRLKRLRDFAGDILNRFKTITSGFMLLSFITTLFFQLSLVFLVDFSLLHSLNLTLPILPFISIVMAVRFLRYIPVTYSGIGIREGLYPIFLQHFGVSFEQAFTLGLLGSSINILLGLAGGILEGVEMSLKKK